MKLPYKKSFWSFWEQPTRARAYLREWSKRVPVVWGRGNLGDADSLSDLQIEASIRDYLYHHLNWTGNQIPNDNPYTDDPVSLLRWNDERSALNDGRGPTWSCGPLATVYVGLLAAFDIPARRVWSSRRMKEDNVAEVWIESLQQWMLVITHTNTHFERGGKRLSFLEWATEDRCGLSPLAVSLSGDGYPRYAEAPELYRWYGWSGHPCVMRGNAPHAGGNRTVDSWQWLQLMPPLADAVKTMPDIKGSPAIIPYGSYDFASVTNGPTLPQP